MHFNSELRNKSRITTVITSLQYAGNILVITTRLEKQLKSVHKIQAELKF